MDGIGLGCLAAVVARFRPVSGVQWLGAALVLAIRVLPLGLYKWGLDITVLEIGAALLLLGMRANPAPSVWTAPLRWFGRNSYEVYLTHMFVVTTGTQLFISFQAPVDSAWLWLVGMVGISGLLGYAVATWYSEPLNRKFRSAAQPVVLVEEANA
jgi:peptidoglycan/LPS O-acetylase OafA/YrhL